MAESSRPATETIDPLSRGLTHELYMHGRIIADGEDLPLRFCWQEMGTVYLNLLDCSRDFNCDFRLAHLFAAAGSIWALIGGTPEDGSQSAWRTLTLVRLTDKRTVQAVSAAELQAIVDDCLSAASLALDLDFVERTMGSLPTWQEIEEEYHAPAPRSG